MCSLLLVDNSFLAWFTFLSILAKVSNCFLAVASYLLFAQMVSGITSYPSEVFKCNPQMSDEYEAIARWLFAFSKLGAKTRSRMKRLRTAKK